MRPALHAAIVLLFLSSTVGATVHAWAQAPQYYRGKELRMVVGSAPGGGYDTYARLAATFLGKHLPGSPVVVVQNMPGGGGLNVSNFMAQKAPRDGFTIAITNRNLIVAPLLGMVDSANVAYDPAQLTWIANLNSDVSFLFVRAGIGVNSIDDLRQRELIVGSSGPTDNNGIFPYIANNLIGTHFKVVTGYPSSNELAFALDRGEIDGIVGFSWTTMKVQRPAWIRDGKVLALLNLGLEPLKELPNVPLIGALAKNDEDRSALELIATMLSLGRPFFAPPQTTPDAIALLRTGFAEMAKDPAFVEAAEKQRFDVTFMDGDTLQKTVQHLNSVGPDVAAIAQRALQQGGTEVDQAPKRSIEK